MKRTRTKRQEESCALDVLVWDNWTCIAGACDDPVARAALSMTCRYLFPLRPPTPVTRADVIHYFMKYRDYRAVGVPFRSLTARDIGTLLSFPTYDAAHFGRMLENLIVLLESPSLTKWALRVLNSAHVGVTFNLTDGTQRALFRGPAIILAQAMAAGASEDQMRHLLMDIGIPMSDEAALVAAATCPLSMFHWFVQEGHVHFSHDARIPVDAYYLSAALNGNREVRDFLAAHVDEYRCITTGIQIGVFDLDALMEMDTKHYLDTAFPRLAIGKWRWVYIREPV